MVILRENTEDIYTGIEFEFGTRGKPSFRDLLKEHFPKEYNKIAFLTPPDRASSRFPKEGTSPPGRAAIQWSLENGRKSVTLVHQGNIMKFTEGASGNWGL